MPCGLYADEAAAQAREHAADLRSLGGARVWSRSTPRRPSPGPGPRLVEGVELLGHLLHPRRVAAPPGLGWLEVEPAARARSR